MSRPIRRALPALVAVALGPLLLGCGSDDDGDQSAAVADGAAADAAADAGGDAGGDVATAAGESVGQGDGPTPLAARSLIRTAEVSMTVDDVAAASDAAVGVAADAGGFQSGGQVVLTDPPSGFVVLRVPNDRFQEVLDAVRALGDVADQSVQVQDVSDQVVDLDSRIAAATASVERVRGFLQEATTVGELASVEGELTARESQLEALLGQRRTLGEQVDLATITARFGVEAAPALVTDPEVSDDIPGFLRAFRYGWVVLVTAFQVVAAVVGFVLPFAVIGGSASLGWRWLARRRRAAISI